MLGEIHTSTPDINSVPSRNLVFCIFGCWAIACVIYVRLVVLGLLMIYRKIIAFEVYLPAMCSWGKAMTRDVLFFSLSESFVASLDKHTR